MLLSLQKRRQYNKNLTKHQTKINTAIITNLLKLQKNQNFKILKSIVKNNKFKKVSMFRSSPPEVFSKKDALQIQSKPTGEQPRRSAISTKSL